MFLRLLGIGLALCTQGPPDVKIAGARNDAAALPEVAYADALVFGNSIAPQVGVSKSIEWVHTAGSGSDQCVANPGTMKGSVILTNSQKVKNSRLAEQAMELVFTLAGSVDVALENMH